MIYQPRNNYDAPARSRTVVKPLLPVAVLPSLLWFARRYVETGMLGLAAYLGSGSSVWASGHRPLHPYGNRRSVLCCLDQGLSIL